MAAGKSQPDRVLQAIDSLLGQRQARGGRWRSPSALLRKDPATGRPSTARGVALMALDRPDEAGRAVPGAPRPPHGRRREEARSSRPATRDPSSRPRPPGPRDTGATAADAARGADRRSPRQIRIGHELETRDYLLQLARPHVWTPGDFGQARMAALGWILAHGRTQTGKEAEFLASVRTARDRTPRRPAGALGLVLPQPVREDSTAGLRGRPRRSPGRPHRPDGALGVPERLGSSPARARPARCRPARQRRQTDTTPPLPAEELEQVLASLPRPAAAAPGAGRRAGPQATSRPS